MKTWKLLVVVVIASTSTVLADTIDLTDLDSTGTINGAIFTQTGATAPSTGTGTFDTFVRIKPPGNQTQSEGYNSDGRPENFDTDNSPFNHKVALKDIPVFEKDQIKYFVFYLDVNENSGGNFAGEERISLDVLKIYQANTGDQTTETLTDASLGTLQYDMDELGDNEVLLDYSLVAGSGKGDMQLLVPVDLFDTTLLSDLDDFIVLYSHFGKKGVVGEYNYGTSDGFEEWGIITGPGIPTIGDPPPVPTPAAALLAIPLFGLFSFGRPRRNTLA